MKKKRIRGSNYQISKLPKILRTMKLICLFMFVGLLHVSAISYSQSARLNVSGKNISLENIFEMIESQSDFSFIYNLKQIDLNKKLDVNFKNKRVEKILDEILNDTDITYTINNRLIVVHKEGNSEILNNASLLGEKLISGTVHDSHGGSLPGVSVVIKGTTLGTVTDVNGQFSITIPSGNQVLQFSFIGMKSVEITVTNQTTLNITLEEESIGLGEVVAVGYGVQKKINLTGSLESIDSESITKRTSTDLSNSLSGLVPGLTVVQNSGQPGADFGTMNIRGIGTLRESDNGVKSATQPLVLVDGIESSLSNIAPNDIENVVILRDASSAAIYGVRAANGVILVTTKRGSEGKARINYNMYIGFQNPTNLPNFLGSAEYAELLNTAYTNDGLPAKYSSEEIEKYRSGSDLDNYPNSDWLGSLFSENGFQQNHNLSISGGSKKMQYSISLNYLDRGGLINNTGYDRYTLRTNIDNQILDNFKVGINISLSQEEKLEPALGLCINQAMREPPIVPIRYSNGDWGVYLNEHNSVAMVTDGGSNTTNTDKSLITLFGELNLTKDLMLKGVASYQKFHFKNKNFKHYLELFNANHSLGTAKRSSLSNYHALTEELNLQSYLTYTKTLNNHKIKALLGYEQKSQDYSFFSSSIKDLPKNNNISELDAGDPDTESNSGYSTEYRIRSGFSRLNYSFKDRYLFEANFRYDGTSRFPSDNRYSLFPSFSAGWRLSEESFFSKEYISNLKLRTSWGRLGNQEIGNYPYQSVYTLGNIYTFGQSLGSGIKPSTNLSNKDITWETTTMLNFGTDIGFLNNRLNFSIDYFIKKTSDILLNLPKPDILGANPPVINAGEILNKGLEFTIKYNNKRSHSFLYNVNANFSMVNNEITDLKGANTPGRSVGDPVFNIFGYEAEGLFQSQEEIDSHAKQPRGADLGDIKYKDQLTVDTDGDGKADSGDGVINGDDRVSLGSYFPGINFGLQFNSSYKSFDFSLTLQGAAKVKGYASIRHIQPFFNRGKAKEEHLDYWSVDNRNASYPRLSMLHANRNWDETTPNSWWVEDASYMRIKNIQLGYTINLSSSSHIKIDKIRLYVGGDNLLTLTGFTKDLDPEIPFGGGLGYPVVSTMTAGMNITF